MLDYEPAVGLVNTCYHDRHDCVSNYVPVIWATSCAAQTPLPVPIISFSNFDAQFNAFHHNALPHLLPYEETAEYQLAWESEIRESCSRREIPGPSFDSFTYNVLGAHTSASVTQEGWDGVPIRNASKGTLGRELLSNIKMKLKWFPSGWVHVAESRSHPDGPLSHTGITSCTAPLTTAATGLKFMIYMTRISIFVGNIKAMIKYLFCIRAKTQIGRF